MLATSHIFAVVNSVRITFTTTMTIITAISASFHICDPRNVKYLRMYNESSFDAEENKREEIVDEVAEI